MIRINDNPKTEAELRQAVKDIALRMNQLERLLDRQEWSEAKVDAGVIYDRMVKLSFDNGMSKSNWKDTELATSVTGLPSNANKSKYMVLQISDNVGAADDPTKWTIDWTRWV